MFLPHPRVKVSIVGSLRDREIACSASDRQGSNFESCVWRTVSSQSSHHPQEVLLAQFSLYVHKGGLKPDSFHFKPAISDFPNRQLYPPNQGIHTYGRIQNFVVRFNYKRSIHERSLLIHLLLLLWWVNPAIRMKQFIRDHTKSDIIIIKTHLSIQSTSINQ